MLQDLVLETTTNPGTNTTVNLAGAVTGFVSWATAFTTGASIYYVLRDGTLWETGSGTFTSGSPNTISRTTVLSNSAGNTSRLNFTGVTQVFCAVPASRAVYLNNSGLMTSVSATAINTPLWGGAAGGTANAVTISLSPANTAYAAGHTYRFISSAVNTGAVTLNANALGAQSVRRTDGSLMTGGEIPSGALIEVVYDGTNFIMVSPNTGNIYANSLNGGPLSGFRNAIINGNFDIWQRGTFFPLATPQYTADRWTTNYNGTGATRSVTRQSFSLGQTGVPGEPTYFLRWDQSVAGSGATFGSLEQRIEDVRTFAGQRVSLSFYAKAGSSITLPSVTLRQQFGTGGSPSANVSINLATNINIGTSWTKHQFTVDVPSISGKSLGSGVNSSLNLLFFLPINSTFVFDVAQVQLEAGNGATLFEQRFHSIERALCERYYEVSRFVLADTVTQPGNIAANTGFWRVEKRTTPVLTLTPDSGSGATISALNFDGYFQSNPHSVSAGSNVAGNAEL